MQRQDHSFGANLHGIAGTPGKEKVMEGKKESARPGAPQTKDGRTVPGNGKTVNIAVYHHEKFGDLRVTDREGKPWFVGQDVARSLGYADPDQALRTHCKQVRTLPVKTTDQGQTSPVVSTGQVQAASVRDTDRVRTRPAKLVGQVRHLKIINESDTLRLVMRSRTPKAVEYQDWVVEEVLPQIHRTGMYIDPKLREGLDSATVNSIFEEMMRPDAQMIRRAERRGARMGVDAYVSLEKGARGFNPDIYGRLVRYYQMGLSYREMSLLLKASQSTLRRWVSKMVLVGMLSPRVKGRVTL